MDGFIQRRYARCLALVAALTCVGPSLCSGQSQSETSSFRSLISGGWDEDGRATRQKQPTHTQLQDELNLSEPVRSARQSEPQPIKLETTIELETRIESKTCQVLPLADLIRQQSEPSQTRNSHASIDSRSSTAIETIQQQIDVATALRSPVANAQAVRLRESARLSLQKSQQRLERRATHTAKMYANESLRAVVAMQDAGQGGTDHARGLNQAMDAIRESQDFAVRFGVIDQASLARLVTVHKTPVLKGRNLEQVSAIEATESYLNFARFNLVQAAGYAREASDALTILGRVERETASPDNSHALAVAMTMQQAAVEIAPHSMLAHRELGITFSRQGLLELAAESLMHSLDIQPTRIGYERLLELSRRTGDVDTARSCVAALRSGRFPNEISVRTMSPELFATTHRPAPSSIQRQQAESTGHDNRLKKADAEPVRLSLRSILPFGRK